MKTESPPLGGRWTTGEPSPKSWIEKNAGVCGGEACIRGMRIPVWGLVQSLNLGVPDAEILRALPSLTPDDLHVARRYYEEHRQEIDAAIRRNEDS